MTLDIIGLHRRTVKGSGGVGFFVNNEVAENHQVTVSDSTNEGILWLQLATTHNQVLRAAVSYLPPANSSRPVNVPDIYLMYTNMNIMAHL